MATFLMSFENCAAMFGTQAFICKRYGIGWWSVARYADKLTDK
jgi:hypothetical protein